MVFIMEEKKEYIIKEAFKLFLNRGYDSVSMTLLHQELNISRGAIYCYFESKDALFMATIDRYYFGFIERIKPHLSTDLTLRERIDQYYSHIDDLKRYYNLKKDEEFFLKYAALIIQAVKIYPDFLSRWQQLREQEYEDWVESILRSIEKGEVREDVNAKIMAKVFVRLVDIFTTNSTEAFPEDNSLEGDSIGHNVEQANYIYSLIKI
jgi:AcrR family transcriptional regulator